MVELHPLTEEEAYIIEDKGTEKPFSGKLIEEKRPGTYYCRRCGTALYRSEDKFDSHCGWPSFDDAIPGRVRWSTDTDGRRTEITCNTCDAHLGHVFIGEQMTNKNTRHCVNSISMTFKTDAHEQMQYEIATLGGGCFRCTEAAFQQIQWVLEVRSGYSGGKRKFPSYEQVSSWATGHIEVIQIYFDPVHISYKQIIEIFFTIHDPTQEDGQGNDIGSQYQSVIFYHSDQQRYTARQVIEKLTKDHIFDNPIVTDLRPFDRFRIAEDYHQNFYATNPDKPYCKAIISPKLAALRKSFAVLQKEDFW